MREGRGGAQPSGMRHSGAWAALFGVWVALVGCGEEATEPPAPAQARAVTAPTFADVATPPLLERAGESLLALPMASVEAGALYIVELEVTPQLQVSLTQARLTASPGGARRAALGAVKAELLGRIGITAEGDDESVAYAYDSLPMVAVWLDQDQLASLLTREAVRRVHANVGYRLETASSLAFMGLGVSGGRNADAQAGAGTTVAVIDTAVRYGSGEFGDCGELGSPDFGAPSCRIARRSNFTSCSEIPFREPGRECVTGGGDYDVVAQATTHGTGVAGVVQNTAPAASLWTLNITHITQRSGGGGIEERIYDAEVIAALEAVHADPGDVVAVNMSLGAMRAEGTTSYCDTGVSAALAALWQDHGVVATVATGNDATKNAIGQPACSPYAVAVGAQYDTDGDGLQATFTSCQETVSGGAVTCFSNSQTAVDVIAPGANVEAGGIDEQFGTSVAAPHAAGVIADLQDGARRLAPWELVTELRVKARNRSETAQGLDDATYSYVHRQLDLTSSLAPEARYPFQTNPEADTAPGGGATTTLALTTADYDNINGSVAGRLVTDVWLDLAIEHPDVSDLTVTLRAPDGSSSTLSSLSGANVNALFGAQLQTGFRGSLDGSDAGGAWQLAIRNDGGTTARVIRATLLLNTEVDTSSPPGTLDGFSFDAASVTADGAQVQTLRVTLGNAAAVDDMRIVVNLSQHAENGNGNGGYFRWTPAGCSEYNPNRYGNLDVELGACQRTLNGDGSAEFVFPFTVASTFPISTNNQVSGIWYGGGSVLSGTWSRLTTSGGGFAVTP